MGHPVFWYHRIRRFPTIEFHRILLLESDIGNRRKLTNNESFRQSESHRIRRGKFDLGSYCFNQQKNVYSSSFNWFSSVLKKVNHFFSPQLTPLGVAFYFVARFNEYDNVYFFNIDFSIDT
jgi:hypothetical protein